MFGKRAAGKPGKPVVSVTGGCYRYVKAPSFQSHKQLQRLVFKVDLSSWEQKIQRDAVDEQPDGDRADERESVLMEQQSDSTMEMGCPSQELYKDGVLTLGCIGIPQSFYKENNKDPVARFLFFAKVQKIFQIVLFSGLNHCAVKGFSIKT